MHVVIENDDTHHHPHAEEQCVFTVEPTCILSAKENEQQKDLILDFALFQNHPYSAYSPLVVDNLEARVHMF